MHDELDGAEEYICLATKYRDSEKQISEMYASMARAEIEHYNKLHEQVCKIQRGETSVQTISSDFYEWLCDKATMKAAKVKYLVDSYK